MPSAIAERCPLCRGALGECTCAPADLRRMLAVVEREAVHRLRQFEVSADQMQALSYWLRKRGQRDAERSVVQLPHPERRAAADRYHLPGLRATGTD